MWNRWAGKEGIHSGPESFSKKGGGIIFQKRGERDGVRGKRNVGSRFRTARGVTSEHREVVDDSPFSFFRVKSTSRESSRCKEFHGSRKGSVGRDHTVEH